jgi:hypothetical protein
MIEPTDEPTPLLHFVSDEYGEYDVHDAVDAYLGYITDKHVFIAHDRAILRSEELRGIADFIDRLIAERKSNA